LHYERKLYLLPDTLANRSLIGKYIEVLQFSDGRIELRVEAHRFPTPSTISSGTVNHGAIVDRAVHVRSTAHRADGRIVPRHRLSQQTVPLSLRHGLLWMARLPKTEITNTALTAPSAGVAGNYQAP
jgi:hypothetical protein